MTDKTILIMQKLERDLCWYNGLIEDCRKGTKDHAYLTGLMHGTNNAIKIVDSVNRDEREVQNMEQLYRELVANLRRYCEAVTANNKPAAETAKDAIIRIFITACLTDFKSAKEV